MAEWWEDPEIAAELAAAIDPDTGEKLVTFQTDPVTGESTGMPLSGTPRHILEANVPGVQANMATVRATGAGSFQEFAAQYEVDDEGYVLGTNRTPWQLFHQARGPGGSPFMDPRGIEGAPEYDPAYAPTDPSGAVGDGGLAAAETQLQIKRTMEDAFKGALSLAGMAPELIDDLWSWAEAKLVEDPSFTAQRALLEMYEHDSFIARFPAIGEMNRALKEGDPARRDIPTPGEYIVFEKNVANELKRVGVQYTTGADFDGLIESLYMNSVGLDEVSARLNAAKEVVYNMPKEVQDTLADWFDYEVGESIVMKSFLDPTDSWAKVQDDIATATVGGWGKMLAGLDTDLDTAWDQTVAKSIADLGLSNAQIWENFGNLRDQEHLFAETLGEGTDIEYATHGVQAAFGLGGADVELEGEETFMTGMELEDFITRRSGRRVSRFRGGGGAMVTAGETGFGAANA